MVRVYAHFPDGIRKRSLAPTRPVADIQQAACIRGTRLLMEWRRAAPDRGDRDIYRQVNKQCRAAVSRDSREHYQREISSGGRGSLWRALAPVIRKKALPGPTESRPTR